MDDDELRNLDDELQAAGAADPLDRQRALRLYTRALTVMYTAGRTLPVGGHRQAVARAAQAAHEIVNSRG